MLPGREVNTFSGSPGVWRLACALLSPLRSVFATFPPLGKAEQRTFHHPEKGIDKYQ
jgi:hypothetical protein